ncbi:probable 28S ribosomal protein S26, mitochondrial [Penaeus japonicus]|uniref:probable 28S ribosomal protein S26, mitochondrial n=1 Tax=Penaeus japonicus TaxID=27405 RepID=UPI001C715E82|nr:probable 28S ribosomal protein S26, mitochondrial [Penaeus japonicus]
MIPLSQTSILTAGCVGRIWYPVGEVAVSLGGVQSVRWRKPRWVPTAKSRLFTIPKRPVVPEEEAREIQRLYNNYRNNLRAVRRHLREEYLRTSATSEVALQQAAEEEAEHQRLMEYNRLENERIAALREIRIKKELEDDLARVAASKQKLAEQAAINQETALRIITETQELVKTFIKREDLEKAIEHAIANPVDYNSAIDQEGYIYRGRNTKVQDIPEEDREQLARASQ